MEHPLENDCLSRRSMSPSHSRRNMMGRSPSHRFDVTKSMDRLRKTMVGEDPSHTTQRFHQRCLGQLPAIFLIGIFHLMIGIPFGVSYFPVGWRSATSSEETTEEELGEFPLPGKEAFGIRLFLLSTMIGQIIFTFMSGFTSPIGLQMVENVPFCHELVLIALRYQSGMEALSTSLVLFGISTFLVGLVFWILGYFHLGNVVYYFPHHVLVGCIGGIGLYIGRTGLEVTMNALCSWAHLTQYFHLVKVVVLFEVILRLLEYGTKDPRTGQPRFALLSPIYFCLLTPIFYLGLHILGVSMETATSLGYFFPPLDTDNASGGNSDLVAIWTSVDFSTVSWSAIQRSLPTMLALILFSLIHVPINIPAFAISTRTEIDMNVELQAHGYANLLATLGGLPNYMAYTQSVLYSKSGGTGRMSGVLVAVATGVLYVVGPTVASFIPRCMAGTLLVHVGLDLFLEGVYDSFGQFDWLEYAGIWLITIVMTWKGMEAAMIAGFVTAVCTYTVQNTAYVHPLRGSMTASTLRSSHWNRSTQANQVLASEATGRNRILVVQLQGHLFFGNAVIMTQSIRDILRESQYPPLIVVLDFGLVLGIDSSAGQSIGKLKGVLQKEFQCTTCIFVTGSEHGFPTDYNLSKELSTSTSLEDAENGHPSEKTKLMQRPTMPPFYTGSFVVETLDEALMFAEDAMIARYNFDLLEDDRHAGDPLVGDCTLEEEHRVALKYLTMLCPEGIDSRLVDLLFSKFEREAYDKGVYIWKQGDQSDSAKLLLRGSLRAELENEAGTSEPVVAGNIIGELGLVEGVPRMSSVVASEDAVLYSLSRDAFEKLTESSPASARLIDLILVRYLSARVQHVSNRIFETRCLPI